MELIQFIIKFSSKKIVMIQKEVWFNFKGYTTTFGKHESTKLQKNVKICQAVAKFGANTYIEGQRSITGNKIFIGLFI